jgi:hypothetical protein
MNEPIRRWAITDRAMNTEELAQWIADQLGPETYSPLVSRGVALSYMEPRTDEEQESLNSFLAHRAERTAKWEREKFEELKAKFEGSDT